jgi:two-component system phosphate regulon sensor histidine kinase PhoR
MKHIRSNLRRRISPVAIYAMAALLCILAFQIYWLHSVFVRQKAQLMRTTETVLRTNILYQDVTAMITIENLTHDAQNLHDSIVRNGDKSGGGMIQIYVEDSVLPDSLLEHITQNLQHPKDKQEASLESLYGKIREELQSTYPNLDMTLIRHENGKTSSYPKRTNQIAPLLTQNVQSRSNPSNAYQLSFSGIDASVWVEIVPSIVLSLLYLLICISAVILLIYSNNKRKKLMLLKDDFTHNMTHEFKTPIATLYAATEALDKYNQIEDTVTAREYIGLMQDDLRRLSAMTDAILNHAKLTDGKMVLQQENIQLLSLLTELDKQFQLQFENTGAQLNLAEIPSDIVLRGDRYHLTAVFSNLIDNALKYTKTPAEISIHASQSGEKVHILFSDKGIGIPEKYKNQVFEPYFRVSESDRYEIKGYGLGLSYVREIITLHHGIIRLVYGEQPGNTTFEIILPLLRHA